jgi:hypothetical protein
MNGGMLVLCDIPKSASDPTTFSPQRAQILLGFEYSMARAANAPGGFTFGGLLSGVPKSPQDVTVVHQIPGTPGRSAAFGKTLDAPAEAPQALSSAPRSVRFEPLGRGTRWALVGVGALLLAAATNLAARRLRGIT